MAQLERLDRGLVAVKTAEGVFLSWRFLRQEVRAATRDRLTGADFLQTCVRGKDLLCHGHSHRSQILLLFSPLLLLPFY